MTTQIRSEMIDGMAAIGDQFRKMTEVVTGQARETITAAQQQFQENVTKTQQAVNDVAPRWTRINEQNCQLMTAAFASFWDTALSWNKLATWGQEQTERALVQAVEQSRVAREEGAALLRDATEQARRHQTELYCLAQECLRAGYLGADKTARRE